MGLNKLKESKLSNKGDNAEVCLGKHASAKKWHAKLEQLHNWVVSEGTRTNNLPCSSCFPSKTNGKAFCLGKVTKLSFLNKSS